MSTTITPTQPRGQDPTALLPQHMKRSRPLFDPEILRRAYRDSFLKLNPITLMRNPVIFVVEVGAALVTFFTIRDAIVGAANVGFGLQISVWLWFTVLFANFAEALAEGRSKAQTASLRGMKKRVGVCAVRRPPSSPTESAIDRRPAVPCSPPAGIPLWTNRRRASW